MAKKKSNLKITTIAGTGLAIVILTPLLLLFAGIEVPVIGKFYQEALGTDVLPPIPELPDEFMIPIDEINENNDMIMDQLSELGACDEEMFALEPELCAQEQDVIDELEDDLIILDPMNMTDFSEDPPDVQICDQLDLGCGSEIMDLKATITKIDSFGNKTVITETFIIPALSFLADPTDFDFKDGFLELGLELNTKRTTTITNSGLFDVFLNGQSILDMPIQLSGIGTSDSEGILPINFISPTGAPSNVFTFNFGLNFDKFVNEQINPLELRVLNLDVDRNGELFSIVNQTIITLDIERDDIKILIIDEELGEFERVYPTDSRLVFGSFPKTLVATSGACIGAGAGTAPAPQIGRIDVLDENGELFTFSNGGTGIAFMDELLTRNANYTVKIFFPSDQGMIEYGKSQETKTFECHSELKSHTCTQSCKRQVKAGGTSWTHCSDIVGSVVIDPIPVCNLPE
jgi:hypothetical protein